LTICTIYLPCHSVVQLMVLLCIYMYKCICNKFYVLFVICKKITMAPFTSFISVYYLLILKWDPLGYLPCSSLWENDNKNSLKMQSYRIKFHTANIYEKKCNVNINAELNKALVHPCYFCHSRILSKCPSCSRGSSYLVGVFGYLVV
jgi:hypothetical protein